MTLTWIRPLLLAAFCLLSAQMVFGQCTQKIATLPPAPELYGFRLGMTHDEIKALVPQTQIPKNDHFGVAKTTINPSFDPTIDQKKFEGVRSISLDLLDDRLTSLWIGYDDTYKIKTVDAFVTAISQSLHVSGNWSSWKSRGQQLRCVDFQLIVSTLAGGPSLRLLDFGAEDTIAARRQEKEEQDSLAESAAAASENNEQETDGDNQAKPIVGDKQSRTYYPSGCHPAKEISDANKAVFKTVEEAEKAGFKLARNCH
ncbi:MAG TPA: hypothetical protein VJS13_08735 [Pyrinomonadaceae bacterium]|nr:hypothetical protein [Pyrinomonadaceae bacterium]